MANNATLKDTRPLDEHGTLVTAGYREVFKRSIDGPGTYKVRVMQPATRGYAFGHGFVTVTQADIEEARNLGHKTLPVLDSTA